MTPDPLIEALDAWEAADFHSAQTLYLHDMRVALGIQHAVAELVPRYVITAYRRKLAFVEAERDHLRAKGKALVDALADEHGGGHYDDDCPLCAVVEPLRELVKGDR